MNRVAQELLLHWTEACNLVQIPLEGVDSHSAPVAVHLVRIASLNHRDLGRVGGIRRQHRERSRGLRRFLNGLSVRAAAAALRRRLGLGFAPAAASVLGSPPVEGDVAVPAVLAARTGLGGSRGLTGKVAEVVRVERKVRVEAGEETAGV